MQLVSWLPTNFALISLHIFLSRSSTRQQMLLNLNPVLSKSNAFNISTKLHGICRAEAFCRAPHHSRKQSYGKCTVKMISCLKHSVFVYIVDSNLCQHEHDPYISSNSSTLEYPSLCHFLVTTAWVSFYMSKLYRSVFSVTTISDR